MGFHSFKISSSPSIPLVAVLFTSLPPKLTGATFKYIGAAFHVSGTVGSVVPFGFLSEINKLLTVFVVRLGGVS